MRSTRQRVCATVAFAAIVGAVLVVGGTTPSGAAPAVHQISVDHTGPAGHNFEYKDFFPRAAAKVAQGDVVDFGWPQTKDGFHTATLLKSGETPAQAWSTVYPLAVPDADDGASQQQLNPAIGAPTNPPTIAGGCGSDAGSACAFDGSSDLNSGANRNDGTSHFFAQVNSSPGTTVSFVCLLHPGMQGSLQVVASGSTTPAQEQAAADTQYTADTAEANAAFNAANTPTSTSNADGTKTWTMSAGTETAHTAVLEFLPSNLVVGPKDKVIWNMTNAMAEIHTVTFPKGTDAFEPIPQLCEADPTDTEFVGAPGPPCGDPTKFEVHLDPAPGGGTTIDSTTTEASSGIMGPAALPFPTSTSFDFPNTGTFSYFCHIHDTGMVGAIEVQAASTTASTTPKFTG